VVAYVYVSTGTRRLSAIPPAAPTTPKSWKLFAPPALAASLLALVAVGTSPAWPVLAWLLPAGAWYTDWYWPMLLYVLPALWLAATVVAVHVSGRKGWLLLLLAPFVLSGWLVIGMLFVGCMTGMGCV